MHSLLSLRNLSLLLMCAVLGTTLGACSSHTKLAKCEENKGAYLRADNHAPLQLPEGSNAQLRNGSLVIPPGNNQPVNNNACLERPPAYYGNAGRLAASPEETVADWAQAWSDRNSKTLLAMYSSQFQVEGTDSKQWLEQRAADVATGALPEPRVRQLQMSTTNTDERIASFTQTFGTTVVNKQLTLVREAGVWKIASERVLSTTTKKS